MNKPQIRLLAARLRELLSDKEFEQLLDAMYFTPNTLHDELFRHHSETINWDDIELPPDEFDPAEVLSRQNPDPKDMEMAIRELISKGVWWREAIAHEAVEAGSPAVKKVLKKFPHDMRLHIVRDVMQELEKEIDPATN